METATVQTPRRLERGNGPLGGVAAGLGTYFNVDPTAIRLALVVTGVLTFPAIPIAYVAAWIIIPKPEANHPSPVTNHPSPVTGQPNPMPAPNPWAPPGADLAEPVAPTPDPTSDQGVPDQAPEGERAGAVEGEDQDEDGQP